MNLKFKKIAAAFTALVMSFNANAGTLTCTGTITMVAIHQPGYVAVMLSSMSNYVLVCRLDDTYTAPGTNPISPATCKALYAGLLTAKVNGYNLNALWFDGDAITTSSTCANFAAGLGTQVNLRFLPIQ